MIECFCINDKDKPVCIPESRWVKLGEKYHITLVTIHPHQGGIQGCELSEISLDESCAPYEFYKLDRLAIDINDLHKLIELIKDSTDLDGVDVAKWIEESQLTIAE